MVLKRSYENEVTPFFIGNNLENSIKCLELAQYFNTLCYAGIHPNDATLHRHELEELKDFIISNINKPNTKLFTNEDLQFFDRPVSNLIAVGECGLDYYRDTSTCKDQRYVFKSLLDLNCERYFLHSRAAHRDMMEVIGDYKVKGVIHSFDGSVEEAKEIIKRGYFIGINGHSLKIMDGVMEIDMSRVMVESDAPYCKMGKTYEGFGYIKTFYRETKKYDRNAVFRRRNEPVNTLQVVEVLSEIKDIPMEDLVTLLEQNTKDFYGF